MNTKVCKQCNRELPVDQFRPVRSRSTGVYKSKPGYRPVCRLCENMNVQAQQILSGRGDAEKTERVKGYFQMLMDAGYPPIHKAAALLMGTRGDGTIVDATCGDVLLSHLYAHIHKLKTRQYSSFDEADEIHARLTKQLREAGLYEQANNLIDEWFEEDV